jgi:hypothetical protein
MSPMAGSMQSASDCLPLQSTGGPGQPAAPSIAGMDDFSRLLPRPLRAQVRTLRSPWQIQSFLDQIPYSTDPIYRSPRRVLMDRRAHCVDGALLAAAALRQLGHRPQVSWIHAVNDDGHMVALFRRGRWWGAIAKSNVVGLRYREPVYASLRELMMSYFNDYWNTRGQRTMRGYTRPLNLARFDRLRWMNEETGLEQILDVELEKLPIIPVLPPGAARLSPMDERSMRAGLLGADEAGLYKPK